ncbi:hypothetical protein Cni_G18842 [Canna indica]|uniref:Uncharacterized protein n=1 Tax=Canna indica TaxID=4628 RepID=A0AAQ3KN98_9LILI|nr:hypothetical protein Cni_G18842 [Canna indica]
MATQAERRFVAAVAVADVAICFMTLSLVALMLLMSMQERAGPPSTAGLVLAWRPCEDTYVVGEGDEALQMTGDDCNDPFFVEVNPHVVHDQEVAFRGVRLAPLRRPR